MAADPTVPSAESATEHPCPCCGGTGRVDPDSVLCGCQILQRDPRPADQQRRYARLQGLALDGITHDQGELRPPVVQDWRRSADAREYAPTEHPMAQLPAVEFFGPADAVCSYVHQHRHDDNGQVLRQLRAFDEEHGTGAVVAGLEAAREHLGGLPELLEELLRRLAPERWSA